MAPLRSFLRDVLYSDERVRIEFIVTGSSFSGGDEGAAFATLVAPLLWHLPVGCEAPHMLQEADSADNDAAQA